MYIKVGGGVGRGLEADTIKRWLIFIAAALSPDRMVAAGSVPVTSADDPRQLRESRDNSPVPKVPIPHGKLKSVQSLNK